LSKEKRTQGRSNVFLGAMLEAGSQAYPVRIRNVSAGGALLESQLLPKLGAHVRLIRGELRATGVLAWQSGDHAGVTFDAPLDVAAWVKRGGAAGQQRVDTIVAALRNKAPVPHNMLSGDAMSLPEISAALDALCERLASVDEIPPGIAEELVKLDTLAQALRKSVTGRSF
jgi:hypothetical protein